MHKIIEEEILHVIQWLKSEHKLNGYEVDRLRNILIKIAHNYFDDRFDSGKNIDKEELDYGAWFQPNIDAYLSNLPHQKVFELFEDNDIGYLEFIDWLQVGIDFDFLYTYEELTKTTKSFMAYLFNNRDVIITTGFPLKSFELNDWFYRYLSKLYPLKIPYSIMRKEKDKEGNFILEYHWGKTPNNSNHSTNLFNQNYINASYIEDCSFENIDLIENKRPMLFDLKIEILNILFHSLLKKNCVGLWDQCLKCISSKITTEDFKSFNQIDQVGYPSPAIYKENNYEKLFKNSNISYSDYLLEPGGLTNMIELIFLVEKELRLGHMNKIKTNLLELSKNRKISTYYDLFLNMDISEIFVIAKECEKIRQEKNKYKDFFKKRLSNSLKKTFKTSLSIELENYDPTTNIPESKGIYKANIRDITPLSLPLNTKWEHIVLQFMDNESIKIKGPKNFEKVVTFREMGFDNRKKYGRPPDKLWDFLYALAVLRGTLSWDDLKEKVKNSEKIFYALQTARKSKQLVSDRLKLFFNIEDAPIIYNKKEKVYQTQFIILPQDHIR